MVKSSQTSLKASTSSPRSPPTTSLRKRTSNVPKFSVSAPDPQEEEEDHFLNANAGAASPSSSRKNNAKDEEKVEEEAKQYVPKHWRGLGSRGHGGDGEERPMGNLMKLHEERGSRDSQAVREWEARVA